MSNLLSSISSIIYIYVFFTCDVYFISPDDAKFTVNYCITCATYVVRYRVPYIIIYAFIMTNLSYQRTCDGVRK